MIGMIALAGIIVRNSILLVDFIEQQRSAGVAFEQAVMAAAQVRAKPILLTALAAMIGALFILDDPIFNGLAISLIFGILVSTLLTLVVIPLLYYSLMSRPGVAIAADEPGAQRQKGHLGGPSRFTRSGGWGAGSASFHQREVAPIGLAHVADDQLLNDEVEQPSLPRVPALAAVISWLAFCSSSWWSCWWLASSG